MYGFKNILLHLRLQVLYATCSLALNIQTQSLLHVQFWFQLTTVYSSVSVACGKLQTHFF